MRKELNGDLASSTVHWEKQGLLERDVHVIEQWLAEVVIAEPGQHLAVVIRVQDAFQHGGVPVVHSLNFVNDHELCWGTHTSTMLR
jgi:hypothetical protein